VPESYEFELDDNDGITEEELSDVQLRVSDPDALSEAAENISKEDDGKYQEFRDEKFKLANAISFLTLSEWAAASEYGAASTSGMAAIYHILQDVLADDEEFNRFRNHLRKTKAGSIEEDANDLLNFVNASVEMFTARPTEQPGPSRGGPSRGSGTSTGRSSGKRGQARKR